MLAMNDRLRKIMVSCPTRVWRGEDGFVEIAQIAMTR
jgi:hypothetical protein